MNVSQAHFNLLLALLAQDLEQDEFALKHTPKDDDNFASMARTYEASANLWKDMNALLEQAIEKDCEISFALASSEQEVNRGQ